VSHPTSRGHSTSRFSAVRRTLHTPHYPYSYNGGVSRLHLFKPRRGADYLFQLAVIASDNVVPVLNLPVRHVRRASACTFELGQRPAICRCLIRIDKTWDRPVLHVVEDFPREPAGRFGITYGAERGKNQRSGLCCRRQDTGKPTGHSSLRTSRQCGTG
jgi:hypothetical protein